MMEWAAILQRQTRIAALPTTSLPALGSMSEGSGSSSTSSSFRSYEDLQDITRPSGSADLHPQTMLSNETPSTTFTSPSVDMQSYSSYVIEDYPGPSRVLSPSSYTYSYHDGPMSGVAPTAWGSPSSYTPR
eukprot:TRINITY_DN5356_c0_g1_i2.p1 TRINITY_DN5356_c0_g1~~TRINITY_DN5356_c0_g1_i2.p1  ORF type:complete len:131 (-),score=13.72 TRINITY_DN5356_c0_g1_i2:8-400(-)